MRFDKTLLRLFLFKYLITFTIGCLTGGFLYRLISVYKPEPIYSYLQIIRNRKDTLFNYPEYNFDPLKLIKINDKFSLELMRSELTKYIFRNKIDKSNLPTITNKIIDEDFSSLNNLKYINKLEIKLDLGFNSIAYEFVPKESNEKFIIYHHGHSGGFDAGENYIDFFLSKGYQVIALSMPTIGMNNQPIIETSNGFIFFNLHSKFSYLEEFEINPIKLFIEPVMQVVNYIDEFYNNKNINMVGISGGGWTTTVSAAVDTRIKNSFSVAGNLPISLLNEHDWGHYELNKKDFYTKFNYLNLYILASSDLNNPRSYIQIFNQNDPCCYGGVRWKKYENQINFAVESITNDEFKIINDKKNYSHTISPSSLDKIHQNLLNYYSNTSKKPL